MLIAFVGIDGSGKSTQVDLLNKFFKKNKYQTFVSKAYGKAEESSLEPFFRYWDSLAITFIFQGLHRQQYVEALEALKENKIVIADRWDETFLSFHSNFGFLSKNKKLMHEWNKLSFNGLIPDITFCIDLEPREAHKRLKNRKNNFLDEVGYKYHKKIRQSIKRVLKGRFVIFINGLQTINEIHNIIVAEIIKKNKKIRIS